MSKWILAKLVITIIPELRESASLRTFHGSRPGSFDFTNISKFMQPMPAAFLLTDSHALAISTLRQASPSTDPTPPRRHQATTKGP
ncbi:hypothetical protein EYC84_010953 [Monilinia fructicola]|uniref:Uncharacterized protein n=1 Tax=Monilinia fructicola TaxID=38448 RepID=A0A5M9J9I8_MONFR|nr:hypothetical protein EYC84_010953 [Monilinia fructicola]